ncbi:MAG TPA: hypothetical protein VKA92_05435 [Segetibacter sp.]|nr:hypothetical protein [Segetibacter sp.]
MKKSFDIKLIKFYLWVGVGYFFLGVFSTIGSYPGKFFPVVFNNAWGVIYVIALNFILFEYTIPFILRRKKAIIYNVLTGILLLFIHLMLYSYGSYTWRLLGIQLHVYTALVSF